MECVRDMYKFEGVMGFFKGVSSPIVARAPIAAVMFTGLGWSQRQLQQT